MTNAQVTVGNYTLVESWSGYALQRSGDSVTPFYVPAVDSVQTNINCSQGTFRFWFKPYWSSVTQTNGAGPGDVATLLELDAIGKGESANLWTLAISSDGNTLSLIAQSDDKPALLLQTEIIWQANQSHLITLDYSTKETALFVDGQLVAQGAGTVAVPPQLDALFVGSSLAGKSVAGGDFDELCCFGQPPMARFYHPLTDADLLFYYNVFAPQAALGPVSAEEIAAREKRMAEMKAQRAAALSALSLDGGGMEAMASRGTYGALSDCVTNVPVYMTNVWAGFETDGTMTVTFDIVGGTNGLIYDVFGTTNMAASSITNMPWVWVTNSPTCSTVVLTNQPNVQTFYILGTPLDSDGDGLTDAYELLISHTDPNRPDAPIILFQPLSQTVDQGDTVSFSVIAQGAPPLHYQWLLGGTAISGETNSSLAMPSAQPSDAGDYTVRVTSPVGLFVLSSNATLTVQSLANWPLVTLTGPRQNYTFKNGATYYVASRVELYGTTTIEGGATIKPDWYYPDSTLAIMGTLVGKTDDPYFPAFLTSVDDDTVGDSFQDSSGAPTTANNGAPYLDLTFAQDSQPALNNLRIRYANQAVTTPAAKRLDVWNCQFLECNAGVVAAKNATASFHNVLFGACGAVVAGSTNFTAIEGEHMTAEATNFWAQIPPSRISLTNSIVVGTIGSGPTLVTDHVAINPAAPVFQQAGSGHYYLTNNSPYRRAGTASISPRLATEFRQKTTQPPLVFPEMIQFAGDLTLGQQVARYTNGAPDYGYYYAALDYTVGWITNRGTITILPGTAIGFRNEYSAANNRYTWWGFDLREGSQFISHGTPTKPNTFVDVQLVQEQLASPCIASFVPDFWPGGGPNLNAAPTRDFRFSNFYANSHWYHAWSGYDAS
jgi:hypothetical protein